MGVNSFSHRKTDQLRDEKYYEMEKGGGEGGIDSNGGGNWQNKFSDRDNKMVDADAIKNADEKWRRWCWSGAEEGFSCLEKFNLLLLPQVQRHAVRRRRLINFILFTSELNL